MPDTTQAPTTGPTGIRMAEFLSVFSLASSLGTGLSMEHGIRSCYIGLQIARELELSAEETQHLYRTELLKDAVCTCWTSPIAMAILGDELAARRDLFFEGDPQDPRHAFGWMFHHMASGAPLATRASHIFDYVVHGKSFWREGFNGACQVAQRIAQRLGMPREVASALLSVFEQWDGKGQPTGTRGPAIPISSRIV
jgi:hypothetical protein